jgi:hypothetical protein
MLIEKLNCGIFRHAIFKDGSDVPPHSSKEECDRFVELDLIWGCGKPFQIIEETSSFIGIGDASKRHIAIICQYI